MHPWLDGFRKLLSREKKYVYLVLLVLLLNVFVILQQDQAEHQRGQDFLGQPVTVDENMKPEPASDYDYDRLQIHLENNPESQRKVKWAFLVTTVFFLFGSLLGTVGIFRLLSKKELIPSVDRTLHITWGVPEVIKAVVLIVCFGFLLNFVSAIFRVFANLPDYGAAYVLLQTLIIDLAALFFIARFVSEKGAGAGDLTGFRRKEFFFGDLMLGMGVYFVILPVLLFLLMILVFVSNLFAYEPPPHPLVNIFMGKDEAEQWVLTFSIVLACVVGPIIEEVFFRGFLYPAVRNKFGVPWGMCLSAALFAFVHENIFSFFPIFFLGLVLSYLYEKRKSVLPCMALHIFHNSIFIGYFFFVKNLFVGAG